MYVPALVQSGQSIPVFIYLDMVLGDFYAIPSDLLTSSLARRVFEDTGTLNSQTSYGDA
jgi:hypothetical protein